MTIELGWWLLPLAITIAAYITVWVKCPEKSPGGYIPDVVSPLIGVGMLLIATIVSLAAWLVWAVCC